MPALAGCVQWSPAAHGTSASGASITSAEEEREATYDHVSWSQRILLDLAGKIRGVILRIYNKITSRIFYF